MPRYCHLNGKLVPEKTARISVLDRGFLLGEGIFETMRSYNSRVFGIDRHLRRLRKGAEALGLQLPSVAQLRSATDELLAANKLEQARVRLTITSGPGGPGINTPKDIEPTVVILAHPLELPSERLYRQGMRAIVLPIRKFAAAPLVGIKSVSYGENLAGRRLAAEAGADEGVFLNHLGDLCEGTASNVFVYRYGELITPDLDSGCLPGITREIVLEIAPGLGLKVRETAVSPIDLTQAEEVFLTSSTRELMPLVEIDGLPIGRGMPGPVTERLHGTYREVVRAECGRVD